MLNFNPDLVPTLKGGTAPVLDDVALRRNQRAIERHIDDDHYVRGVSPGEFVLAESAAFATILADPLWGCVEMPAALDSTATFTFRKPSEWRTGQIALRLWYTASVGGTNAFRVNPRIHALRGGEVVPGTSLRNQVELLAGPAVANTLVLSAWFYTSTALGADDEVFSLRIRRTGSIDTNPNSFYLFCVELKHIPAERESQ